MLYFHSFLLMTTAWLEQVDIDLTQGLLYSGWRGRGSLLVIQFTSLIFTTCSGIWIVDFPDTSTHLQYQGCCHSAKQRQARKSIVWAQAAQQDLQEKERAKEGGVVQRATCLSDHGIGNHLICITQFSVPTSGLTAPQSWCYTPYTNQPV